MEPLSKIRAFLYKKKMAKCGKNVTIFLPTTLIQLENIYLKSNILIGEYCWIQGGKKLEIGNFIHICPFSNIGGGGHCTIEDFATISVGCRIFAGTDNIYGEGLTDSSIPPEFRSVDRSFVHIGKYAFLATNSVIHPGVTIGEGAVIGSGSIVTKNIEPWTINIGQPAKPIKKRPKDKIIKLANKLLVNKNLL